MTDAPQPQLPSALPSPVVEACKRDRLKFLLAVSAFVYLIFVTCIYAFFIARSIKIDGEAAAALGILTGLAVSLVKDTFGFVFGSSQGSEDKNTTIAAMTQQPTAIADPSSPITAKT